MSTFSRAESGLPGRVSASVDLAEVRAALHLALSHLADVSDAHYGAMLAVNSAKDAMESALLRTAGASASPQGA